MFACGGTHLFLSGFWMMNTPSTKGNGRPVHFEVRDASALDLFSVSSPMSGWWRRTSSGTIQQVGSLLCASRETADVQVLLKEFGASNLPPSDFFSSREGNNPTFAGRSLMAGGSFTWSFHRTHPASAALDKKQEEARVVTGGAGRGLMINSEPETLWCGVTIYWDFIWPSMEQLSFLYGWYAELLVVNIRIFHCHRNWKEPELLGFPHLIEKSPRDSGRLRVHNNWDKLYCFGTYAAIYELCAPMFLALPLLPMYDCCLVSQRLFLRVCIYYIYIIYNMYKLKYNWAVFKTLVGWWLVHGLFKTQQKLGTRIGWWLTRGNYTTRLLTSNWWL